MSQPEPVESELQDLLKAKHSDAFLLAAIDSYASKKVEEALTELYDELIEYRKKYHTAGYGEALSLVKLTRKCLPILGAIEEVRRAK